MEASRGADTEKDDGRRVVVTGVGVVSALGSGETFWSNLLAGETGIDKIEAIPDVERFACQIGAEVRDFEASEWFASPKSVKSNDRYTHFAVAAARMAVADGGLVVGETTSTRFVADDDEDKDADALSSSVVHAHPARVGCMIGSAFGGILTVEKELERMQKRGPRKVSPFAIPALLANTASGVAGIELDLRGPNFGVASACASGTHAIGEALAAVRRGDADAMICGGSEAAVTELMFAGFGAMRAMTTGANDSPKVASRPFDKDRSGFVMGEGAGVLLIETLEHARKRNAPKIYAELAGYGATCDAHHITTPEPTGDGLARCLEMALGDAKVAPEDVGHVNAHGTSTPYNDKFETLALKRVFGEHAHNLKVTSVKGATGHTLGAAGGVEAVATVLALHTGTIPPTINLDTPDPDCDLNYVPHQPVHDDSFLAAVSENLGFGGHNGALVFKRFDHADLRPDH